MRFDLARIGRQLAIEQQNLAIKILTQTDEENDRDEREWDAAHPEQVAQRRAWRVEKESWAQAKAEGRVERYYVPPKEDNWDDGPFRDHWGHWEERIVGTDQRRNYFPGLY